MKKGSRKAREKVLVRIWDDLEEIHTQLTSDLADEFTLEELEKIDEAISGVLKRTTARFNEIAGGLSLDKKKQ
jgi:hypothetical protein